MATNINPFTLVQRLEESYSYWAELERLFSNEFDIEESDRRLAEIIEARAERLDVFMHNYLQTVPDCQREAERERLTEQLQTKSLEQLEYFGVLDLVLEYIETKEPGDE